MENEDGAGNLSGNTPVPHNTGVGVSTRRTTYVMVSKRNESVESCEIFLFIVLHLFNLSELHLRL